MRRPILLLIIMAIAYSQSEITSPDIIRGMLFPLLFSAAFLILLIWLVRRFSNSRKHDSYKDDGSHAYFLSGKDNKGDSGDSGGDGCD